MFVALCVPACAVYLTMKACILAMLAYDGYTWSQCEERPPYCAQFCSPVSVLFKQPWRRRYQVKPSMLSDSELGAKTLGMQQRSSRQKTGVLTPEGQIDKVIESETDGWIDRWMNRLKANCCCSKNMEGICSTAAGMQIAYCRLQE